MKTIINYVRENGDISMEDIVNVEPFNNYDVYELFGMQLKAMVVVVNLLHNSVRAA